MEGGEIMYQVTWCNPKALPSEGHFYADTWEEVSDWIEDNGDDEKLAYWTAAVVCEAISGGEHAQFYPTATAEKGHLMNNLVKMLPDGLEYGEISALLMSFAGVFWGPKDLSTGFHMLSQVADSMVEVEAQLEKKQKLHKRKLN